MEDMEDTNASAPSATAFTSDAKPETAPGVVSEDTKELDEYEHKVVREPVSLKQRVSELERNSIYFNNKLNYIEEYLKETVESLNTLIDSYNAMVGSFESIESVESKEDTMFN